MNANEAITKIKLLLGLNEETTLEFAMMSLVDGTQVEVEGEFEVGKQCMVVTDEEKISAPEGVHEMSDGTLITIDEAGVITDITEVEAEEVKEEVEVAMEEVETEGESKEVELEEEVAEEVKEEMTDEEKKEEAVSMATEVITMLKPYLDSMEDLKIKVDEMESKFESFSSAPAKAKIKRNDTYSDERMSAVDRIAKIKSNKK